MSKELIRERAQILVNTINTILSVFERVYGKGGNNATHKTIPLLCKVNEPRHSFLLYNFFFIRGEHPKKVLKPVFFEIFILFFFLRAI